MQYDWGEFHYEQEGQDRKVYGFTAVLSYSRMRFITFVKRCDAQTMLRCIMEAFEYFGGLPKAAIQHVGTDPSDKTSILESA